MDHEGEQHDPKGRVVIGVAGICLFILVWAVLAVWGADSIQRWPIILQFVYYTVAGLGWVVPLKPLLRWMETGNWK